MKMNVRSKSILAMLVGTLLSVSCKKDDEDVPNPQQPEENEMITTVRLIMVDAANSSNTVTADYNDPDGNGKGTIDTIRLNPVKTYNAQLILLDGTQSPADTISNEVMKEAEQHQFFYTPTGAAGLTVSYTDFDKNGVPLGLRTKLATGPATTDKNGKLKVVLKHQPDEKPKTGNGDSSKGSIDVSVEFPIVIR